MADTTMVEKSADADLLREMIGFAARQLMELEVEAKAGAALLREKRRAVVAAQRIPQPRRGDLGGQGGTAYSESETRQRVPICNGEWGRHADRYARRPISADTLGCTPARQAGSVLLAGGGVRSR